MWPPPWGLASGWPLMLWGTSYRWWILVTTTSTLDSTLAARYGTMDVVAAHDLQQREGQVRYDISVFMNQLLLSFARTKKSKKLTLTMGLHRSPEHQQWFLPLQWNKS
jgi:hypothetical protein